MKEQINFIECNSKKGLLAVVIPMIMIMFLDLAYNLVDSLWVGNLLGKTDYAALTNSIPVVLFLVAISLGGTNGISILISQAIGSKDKERTDGLIGTSFILSIGISIIMIIILEIFLPEILRFINVPMETYNLAYKYLSIYILGYLPVYLYLYFSAVLRSFGDMKFQVIAMAISIILNIVLDPLFIKYRGFEGVAIATVISQTIALGAMIFHIYSKRKFSVSIRSFHRIYVLEIIEKAIPSIVQQSFPAISTLFLTAFISSYGIIPLAAYGVITGVERILLYLSMALNMVLTIILGQCFGGNRIDRVKDYLRISLKYGSLVLVGLAIVIGSFSKEISTLFIRGNNISSIVMIYFIIVGFGYVLNCITNCFLGFLNGIGKPSKGMLIMMFYYLVVRIPLAYIFSNIFGLGLKGIWIAILVSHIMGALISVLYSKGTLKKLEIKLATKDI